jgi:hypothetical protein
MVLKNPVYFLLDSSEIVRDLSMSASSPVVAAVSTSSATGKSAPGRVRAPQLSFWRDVNYQK